MAIQVTFVICYSLTDFIIIIESCLKSSKIALHATFCAAVVNKTCHENENQFFCIHDSRCIDGIFVCDGHRDCSDGADERYDLCKSVCNDVVFFRSSIDVFICNTR